MENKVNGGPVVPKVSIKDIPMFGKLLSRSRSVLEKSLTKTSLDIPSISANALTQWEQGVAFPTEDKIPGIAKAYGIDPKELERVLKISKAAREMAKSGRTRI